MGEIGYAAANVSDRDLTAGYEAFQESRKEASFPFVSANLVFQSSGKPIVDPYVIVKLEPKKYPALKSPLKIAITGVTRFIPTFLKSVPPKDNVIIATPADELKKYLPEMRKKADQVIVLAAMPRDDAHVLAKEVPGVDLVVGASGGFITSVEEKEGAVPIFYCGTQGKYLGELRVLRKDNAPELKTTLHYLSANYPSDPTMEGKVSAALAEINNSLKTAVPVAASAPGAAAAAAAPDPVAFVTPEKCKSCHEADYTAWQGSKHASAMKVLIDKQADFKPECLACHVLGYKRKDGFVDMKTTPALAAVQCESCHGAGARHIKNPQVPYGRTTPLSCVRCHNKENSPNFEYNEYWNRIRHGR